MDSQLYNAIEACRQSAICCKECAAALQETGNENCIKICMECAMICELCVSLGESNSIYFQKSLDLAMDACMNCISVCENNASANCMKCAWQCRKATVDFLNFIG
jgi:hypothetical protein